MKLKTCDIAEICMGKQTRKKKERIYSHKKNQSLYHPIPVPVPEYSEIRLKYITIKNYGFMTGREGFRIECALEKVATVANPIERGHKWRLLAKFGWGEGGGD